MTYNLVDLVYFILEPKTGLLQ